MTVWKQSPMPMGVSVLCWDAVTNVMFVGYRSGDDIIPEPGGAGKPTPFQADWWRMLPNPSQPCLCRFAVAGFGESGEHDPRCAKADKS